MALPSAAATCAVMVPGHRRRFVMAASTSRSRGTGP
jgi:hypothetical protein